MKINAQINTIKMKLKLLNIIIVFSLLSYPNISFGQAPNLGVASSFTIFTVTGAFGNIGATNIIGDIGTNAGAFTGFPPGTVTGQIHVADLTSVQAATDVDASYTYLSGINCDSVIGTTLGNNQVLIPNVYCLGDISTLNDTLYLNAQGNADAIFVFKINGAFSTSIFSNVILINSASLCNVYWQINGAFDLGDSSVFNGTAIVNGAISLLKGSSLLGRGLSRAGAISLNNNIVAIGIQPIASIISANGSITLSAGDSVILSGNIDGTWNNAAITQSITVKTSGDYFVTNSTCCDSITSNHIIVSVSLPVELLNFIAIPMNGNIKLNWITASETNNDNFTVSRSKDGITFEKILYISGAGNSNSMLKYSVMDNNPYVGISYYQLKQTDFDGKYTYSNIVVVDFLTLVDINIYPNPFTTSANIMINDASQINKYELCIYNSFGAEVINIIVSNQFTSLETSKLPSGIYFYKVFNDNKVIQSGKLVSQQ